MAGIVVGPLKKVVLDSGPLYSAITLELVKRHPGSRNSILSTNKLHSYLQSQKAQKNFLLMFNSIQTVFITSHVVGELKGLQKLKGDYEREFWLYAIELFRSKSVDERLIRLLDLSKGNLRDMIPIIGPVDAGLIELARAEGCDLLTEDGRMANFVRDRAKFQLVRDLVEW